MENLNLKKESLQEGKYYEGYDLDYVINWAKKRLAIFKGVISLDDALDYAIGEKSLASSDAYNSKDRELVEQAKKAIKKEVEEKGLDWKEIYK